MNLLTRLLHNTWYKDFRDNGYTGEEMKTDKEVLKELVKIRELLEQQGSTNRVINKGIAQNKCLGCGSYHPQNTPCPHMMTYCGDIE